LIGNRVIADIQKELAVKTGEAPARFFPRLKREALVTIINAALRQLRVWRCAAR
jgi:hypothetical protein